MAKPIKSNTIVTIVILILVLLVSSFCYASIIYKVNRIDQKLNNDEIKKRERMCAHVSKKISGYILIFICQ